MMDWKEDGRDLGYRIWIVLSSSISIGIANELIKQYWLRFIVVMVGVTISNFLITAFIKKKLREQSGAK